jgi:hypothetical protein
VVNGITSTKQQVGSQSLFSLPERRKGAMDMVVRNLRGGLGRKKMEEIDWFVNITPEL